MNIDLTPLFQAIIILFAAMVTYKLVPWIKARTTQSQQTILFAVVKTLVFAAEQIYGAGKGAEKLLWVKQQMQARGYDIDTAAIEAAVGEYLNCGPELAVIEEAHPPEEGDPDAAQPND